MLQLLYCYQALSLTLYPTVVCLLELRLGWRHLSHFLMLLLQDEMHRKK